MKLLLTDSEKMHYYLWLFSRSKLRECAGLNHLGWGLRDQMKAAYWYGVQINGR